MNNWRCTVLLPTPEDAQNIAQRQLNIAILSATRWQNNHIFRQVLGKFLIVSTDLHPAIATTHHYKLLEGSAFHSLHNLVGKSADLCMGKITDDFSLLYRHRRLANHCYHLREVLVPFLACRDMLPTWITCGIERKDSILARSIWKWRHDAISGEDDRPVKRLKHLLLSPSHFAIIAHQMLVLLQLRIKWSDNISLWA